MITYLLLTPKVDDQHSSEPAMKVLNDLSREVTDCWYSLGIQLGVKETALANIDGNNPQHTSPQQKAFKMLVTWYDLGSATYGELAEALKHVGKDRLAKEYCAADKCK